MRSFLLSILFFASAIVSVAATNNCSAQTHCRDCLEDHGCVWCYSKTKCYHWDKDTQPSSLCGDFRWSQCVMPDLALVALVLIGIICIFFSLCFVFCCYCYESRGQHHHHHTTEQHHHHRHRGHRHHRLDDDEDSHL